MAVVTVAFEDLDTWLRNQPDNTVDTPYELNITGLTLLNVNNYANPNLGMILVNNSTKYVDLQSTILPSLDSLSYVFKGCGTLIQAPAIPNSVTNMDGTFYKCKKLIQAPEIPNSVISMDSTFYECTSLTEAPEIPNSVIYMDATFRGCNSLIEPPVISNSVTEMNFTFYECTSLIEPPVIPNSVTEMNYTFKGCTSLVIAPNIPDSVSTVYSCFKDCSSLTAWKQTDIPANIENYASVFEGCINLVNIISDRPYELKQLLTTLYTASTDNFPTDPDNCTYNLLSSPAEIPFSLLNNELATLPANTTNTPYSINVTELTSSDIGSSRDSGTLGAVLIANNTKYVDLSSTVLPRKEQIIETFYTCTSLVKPPILTAGARDLYSVFADCTSMNETPIIPNGVVDLDSSFQNCTSLAEYPVIPNSVISISGAFAGMTISFPPILHNGIRNINACFSYCRNLVNAPLLPDSVTFMSLAFEGCSSLINAPTIPENVTDMTATFRYCTSLQIVPNIPKNVNVMYSCFEDCTSLEEITLFEADLESLVTNNHASNAFSGCTSLTKIGVPSDPPTESDWHAFRLKFDATTVQGKVYDQTGTAVTISQSTVTKSTLKLPIKTDELWFPNGYTDAQIDEIIQKVIQYRYTYRNDTDVLDPAEKNFVLWADDPDKVISNILGGGGSGGAVCDTESTNPAKVAKMKGYVLQNGNTFQITFENANTSASALTLNVNGTGAKPIYFNNSETSSSHYNIPAGTFMCRYNGTNYYIDTTYAVISARSSGSSTSSTYSDYSRQGAYCATASGTQAKVASMRNYVLQSGATFPITFTNANSYNGKITLNVNSTGAKDIYINDTVSSSSNKTLPAGTYLCRYSGSAYYIDTAYAVTQARNANYAYTAGSTNTAASCTGNSATATKAVGNYTGSGGQQNPQYVGKNRVCFNMMNTPINGNSQYKDFMMMDCYSGFDVGGTVALGVSRQSMRVFAMRANAGTSPNRPTSWAESCEINTTARTQIPVGGTHTTNGEIWIG